jgi:hypothetical protein
MIGAPSTFRAQSSCLACAQFSRLALVIWHLAVLAVHARKTCGVYYEPCATVLHVLIMQLPCLPFLGQARRFRLRGDKWGKY